MRAERGFTLIEILVVIAIIGTTIGFAMLAFGDFGASRRAVVAAEQFSSYLKLIQQQAILTSSALGVTLKNEGYETYRFAQGTWQSMPPNSIFHRRSFPANVVANLHSVNPKANMKTPDIMINSAGNMTEFSIDFGTSKKPNIAVLLGKKDGQLIIQQAKAS